ncbi:MAG: prolipoprotein diacylglyceryl transferase [Pseudomonadota bacterium]
MLPLALPFPNIDPIAFSIGPIDVRWYGLAYMAGLLLGWLYIRRLLSTPKLWPGNVAPFSTQQADDLLVFMTVGVIIGGRLGSVLLYEPGYYFSNPLEIPAIWRGGMAFHGALLGCGVSIWVFAWRYKTSAWSTMDLCAAAVPIGLFFGRVANFINGELWGRETDLPWGMVFPGVAQMMAEGATDPNLDPAAARHPSQLYEAALEGLVLFLVIRWLTHAKAGLQTPGLVVGVFLVGYALARSFSELYRQYDPFHVFSAYGFTPGIVYSIPMVLLGVLFVRMAQQRARTATL